jgi:prephenate dehydrogenase
MKSILILGLGLIGGSLAKALKESELEYRIHAYDPDQLSLENALNDKSIDVAIDQIEAIPQIEDLSLIILSSSIDKTIENLKLLKSIGDKTLFVSLASSLTSINDFVESEGIKNIIFMHPISGSHKSGYENASPNMFDQKNVISVNVNDLQENQTHEIEKIWSSIGSNTINMSLDDHERFLMFTSHLPHLIAYTTMLSIDDEVDISKYSAGGLKEFLRIAESNPDLWADIFSSNSNNLIEGSEIFIKNMKKIIGLFDDQTSLQKLLSEIRNQKQKL